MSDPQRALTHKPAKARGLAGVEQVLTSDPQHSRCPRCGVQTDKIDNSSHAVLPHGEQQSAEKRGIEDIGGCVQRTGCRLDYLSASDHIHRRRNAKQTKAGRPYSGALNNP